MGELWGVYFKDFFRKLQRYKGTAPYLTDKILYLFCRLHADSIVSVESMDTLVSKTCSSNLVILC